jgi:hypothetical protein
VSFLRLIQEENARAANFAKPARFCLKTPTNLADQ